MSRIDYETPMVSIIIPIHNTGKILLECIDTLLAQTYNCFELLCVNDASDDPLTCKILNAIGEKDSRITVINNNGSRGAAGARNSGFRRAQGELVMFLDSDDKFDQSMLAEMTSCMIKTGADFCVSGYQSFSDESRLDIKRVFPIKKKGITDDVFSLSQLGEDGLVCWTPCPWNKMYRKSFITDNALEFQSLPSSNDVFFTVQGAICAKKIAYCETDIPLQFYRCDNKAQISATRNPADCYWAIQKVIKTNKREFEGLLRKQIIYFLVCNVSDSLRDCSCYNQGKQAYEIMKSFLSTYYEKNMFLSRRVTHMIDRYLSLSYDEEWYKLIGDYDRQLNSHADELLSLVEGYSILIWGNGKRSLALQRFFNERNISDVRITDLSNNSVNQQTVFGFEIIHSRDVSCEEKQLVFASNQEVYEYIIEKNIIETRFLICLEDYCEL